VAAASGLRRGAKEKRLKDAGGDRLARALARATSWWRDAASGDDLLFHWLQSPRLERLARAGTQRFSGWVLWYGDRLITELVLAADGSGAARITVAEPREAVARSAPGIPGAPRCGFTAEVAVPETAARLSFTACFADGAREPLLEVDMAALRSRRDELERMGERVDAVPLPPPEVVFLTQGLDDVEFYRCAIVPAALNTVEYLRRAGADLARPCRVLDFGCGSGRLLVGWNALASGHALCGCDINATLVDWARAHLPSSLDVRLTAPLPPLPYADSAFDVVIAISVFTHLSLESQRRWVGELRRILRPGGLLLLTLHGESYLPLIFPGRPEVRGELRLRGHLVTPVGAEGSNQFASMHTRGFARRLFEGFELAGCFPNGRLDGRRLPFPTTSILQDVYVFRRRH
jgi:SAM-dependent methyltransferase